MSIEMKQIGTVGTENGFSVKLAPEYVPGLAGLEGFGHVAVVWYADRLPGWDDAYLTVDKPYRLAPEKLGIFATRSCYRPNSVCVSIAAVTSVDTESGTIGLEWIDAENGTPVLDVKPYHPSSDRIRDPKVPGWCGHWPVCLEESGNFAWDKEFLF